MLDNLKKRMKTGFHIRRLKKIRKNMNHVKKDINDEAFNEFLGVVFRILTDKPFFACYCEEKEDGIDVPVFSSLVEHPNYNILHDALIGSIKIIMENEKYANHFTGKTNE